MPYEYRFHRDPHFCWVRGVGRVDLADFMTLSAALLTDPHWKPGIAVLVDYRELSEFALDADDLGRVVDTNQEDQPQLGALRIAVLTPKDVVFGLHRMWQSFSEGAGFDVLVCRVPAEAEAHLRLPEGTLADAR